MGARNTGGGYEKLANGFRLRFMWSGKRRTPYLELAPTAKNEVYVQKLVATIAQEIKLGVFDYARHFPDSKEAKAAAPHTFQVAAEAYLKTLVLDHGTMAGYRSSVLNVWGPVFNDRPLASIKPSEIRAVVAERRMTVTAKTTNGDLTALRGVFKAAIEDRKLAESPVDPVKNAKHQSPEPDPFTAEEMMLILDHLRERAPVPVWAYFQFAFTTGLRPSEQIALRWSEFSLTERSVKICRARTYAREKATTKTKVERRVNLGPPALEALEAMKPFTFMKGEEAPIFCNPKTGGPWAGTEAQRVVWFQPALRKLGISKRDAYQTRHTFATLAIMAPDNPNHVYIAKQLGHSPRMLFKHYARWIDGADNGRERAKLEASWPRAGHGLQKAQGNQSNVQVVDLKASV